ncbi:GntR family transcriptional regulator [Paenibacillaceae bacterium]|nr:GntR family transcriptional regulator [Paenibacillaceae bacterium]
MLDNIKLDKDSPIPLYYQLKELIKSEIKQGHLNYGDMIPSERELVDVCQISRPTVRQAINELVTEGMLLKEKGRGTFVAKPKIDQWFLQNLLSFSKEMALKGLKPSTKVLKFEAIKTDEELHKIFGDDCKEVFCLERIRFADDQPVVVVTSYIPCHLAPNFLYENLEESSLYELIESKYGHQISHATRVLEAINVFEEDVKLLKVEPQASVHLIKTTGYLMNNQPFEYSIARYRGDNNSFTVTLKYQK